MVAAASVAFGLQSLWIWLASLYLCTEGAGRADRVRRAAFLMLVLAAGLIGLALLAVPEATGAFFAWELKPAPLAAFAGGVYVGSAIVYAAGLRVPLAAVRSLLAAAVVLSVSVFAITLAHLDIFDLGRLQAWAWLVLFAGFAVATSALLVRRSRRGRRACRSPHGSAGGSLSRPSGWGRSASRCGSTRSGPAPPGRSRCRRSAAASRDRGS